MPYATGADFCRIFVRDMNRLYLLSFLLTGHQAMAEKCFVRGLDDSSKGNPVFKKWAESWAQRTIIRNAIQIVRPRPADGGTPSSAYERSDGDAVPEPAEILAVVELPSFERFVFVMSVLERYSDQECSLLLGCTRGEVTRARTRALQQIGSSAQVRRKVASLGSDQFFPGAQPHFLWRANSVHPKPNRSNFSTI
jgi:DNA-directed RNA polymerase specialized sigma24 family protein